MEKSKVNSKSSRNCTHFYGIDVSMETLVTAKLLENGTYTMREYANTALGIAELIDAIEENGIPHLTLVTLEATATYSMKVVFELISAEIPVAVLNPKQAAGFISGVMLRTTKTDDRDAQGLAMYGQVNRPKTYQFPDAKVVEIKQLRNLLFQLKKTRSVYINQLHALEYHHQPNEYVIKKYEQYLDDTERDIAEVEGKLCTMSKETFDKLYSLATSIKGIGPATGTLLLTITNGCKDFKNVKQLAIPIAIGTGYLPNRKTKWQVHEKARRNFQNGSGQVRALLFMCARSAKRFNIACKELYERLTAKGKCHSVAMMAVAHKLVKQFFAVIKSGVPFDNEYHLKAQEKQATA